MSNTIVVTCRDKKASKLTKAIYQGARKALFILKKKNVVLEITFVDDAMMRDINRRFRKKDKSTNVLSFRETEWFPHPELKEKRYTEVGEIYLNCSYIKREAKEKKEAFMHELHFMLVHGILHILGYDHVKKSDKIIMEQLEQKLLQQITNSKHQTTSKY